MIEPVRETTICRKCGAEGTAQCSMPGCPLPAAGQSTELDRPLTRDDWVRMVEAMNKQTEHGLELARENARLRGALHAIRAYAENAAFGRWRFQVAAIVDEGLDQ